MTSDELKLALRCAADPVALAHAMGLSPYEWQQNFLRSRAPRKIMNVTRRGGKDETEAAECNHHCAFDAKACVVAISDSEAKAKEWLHTFRALHARIPAFMRPKLVVDNITSIEFANGARVISLPCTESAPRGWGATRLFLNEASRIPDEVYLAARPTIAATKGTIVLASTPNGPQGFFFETWQGDGVWERYLVRADESPHLEPAFLAEEKAALGSRWYRQEYMCEFTASDESIFAPELLDKAFAGDFPPLFANEQRGTGT